MRTLLITATNSVELTESGVVCHDVRNPAQRNEILGRKGSPLHPEAERALIERGVQALHVAIPDLDDVSEDAAARRLALAVAGAGISRNEAHYGQVTLRARGRGMLRVDRAMLERVNECDDVLLLTAEPDRAVDSDMTLGV